MQLNLRLLMGLAVCWTGIALQVTILARGGLVRMWTRYPFFYAQLAFSLFSTSVGLFVFITDPESYGRVYWDAVLLPR